MNERNSSGNDNESPGLDSRVAVLESAVVKLKEGPSWKSWIKVLSKLLLPILLFWLVFTFKDSVQHALEYRRLEVESAQAIEKLLQTLHMENLEMGKATAAALTLSAYGDAAIMPLVGALEHGSSNTETAARQALFVIGLNHPDALTRGMAAVLAKRQGQFRWQTHQAAIEILGKVAHPEARDVLLSYRPLLTEPVSKGLPKWKRAVQGAEAAHYEETRKTLMIALAALGVNWKPVVTGGGN